MCDDVVVQSAPCFFSVMKSLYLFDAKIVGELSDVWNSPLSAEIFQSLIMRSRRFGEYAIVELLCL